MSNFKTQILFANCGVQYVCEPIRRGLAPEVDGRGWQRARYHDPDTEERGQWPFIQWQVLGDKFILAVDTSTGDPQLGHCAPEQGFIDDYHIMVEGLLGPDDEPLDALPPIELVFRPEARAGEPRDTHLVVDFGNSRTCALLMELRGHVDRRLELLPFELMNRYQLDAFKTDPSHAVPADRSFSSRTCWSTPPYLPIEDVLFEQDSEVRSRRLFWSRTKTVRTSRLEKPRLFQDLSMVRLGREADDLSHLVQPGGDLRLGLSSPKRYLWADDGDWLEGAHWQMADPFDRSGSTAYVDLLHGPLMKYFDSADSDRLLKGDGDEFAAETLPHPQHAPRVLMAAALYELLCQAYVFINSPRYRERTGDAERPRQLRSLTLTYPSGMIPEERERFRRQAEKALHIFHRTLGARQVRPELCLSIDEASAVHLTYMWGQLQMLGHDPRLWFSLLGQSSASPSTESPETKPVFSFPNTRGRATPEKTPLPEVRLACIDIGGGSTDLMIARYWCQSGTADFIHGQRLHRDGVSVAGDKLVKRLLETTVVPAFAQAAGLEQDKVQFLFGPETPHNRALRAERISWLNRLFIPLAHRYLDLAAVEDANSILSHTDPDFADRDALDSLQRVIDAQFGPGRYRLEEPLELRYRAVELEALINEVFGDLLHDFCARIVDQRADLVLLAGQPAKLPQIQRLVQLLLPLPSSRVISMAGHYAGSWYPYQDEAGARPGMIVDAKSTVVVGAALEFLARNAMLPQFHFEMQAPQRADATRYFWGALDQGRMRIRRDRIFFRPDAPQTRLTLHVTQPRMMIGRKLFEAEHAEAAPVYVLQIDRPMSFGEIQITVELERKVDPDTHEEVLELLRAEGTIGDQPAVLGRNVRLKWRTLADERFYLDTGALDQIDLAV